MTVQIEQGPAEWATPEFAVSELPGGRWRAVRTADPALVAKHIDWSVVALVCAAVSIRYGVTERQLWGAPMRFPLGGLDV